MTMTLRRDKTEELRAESAAILDKIGDLTVALGKVEAQLKSRKDVLALTDDVVQLKTEIEDMKIQKARLTEDHEREVRETKHFVGLEKKRQEVELEHAKRDAQLSVREENLDADKKRFDEHVKFVEDRLNKHLDDIKDLLSKVMDRIPTVTVDVSRAGDE